MLARRRRVVLGADVEQLEARCLLAAGGGVTAAGFVGEYFANASLTGTPSFTRNDVRIDFEWGNLAPGGSTSPHFTAVGADNFSARWTGQLVPRFSETYTLRAVADDGVRVRMRPAGATNWTTVIDNWPATPQGTTSTTGTFAVTAGANYDVAVEYREFTGSAAVRLLWSSQSTPEEVIEPLQSNGYMVEGRGAFLLADAMRHARSGWQGLFGAGAGPGTDANGWPLGDAEMVVWEGASDTYFGGTYNARFTGRADVGGFPTPGVTYRPMGGTTTSNSLTSSQIYDPVTNTSSFQIVVQPNTFNSPFVFRVSNTRRLPTDTTATGITDLQIMRPRTVGGNDPYPFGTLFTDAFKSAASVFTSYRWLDTNGQLTEREWADRTTPQFGRADRPNNAAVVHKDWTYEYQIMFSNETGKDLYLTVPMLASNDYFQKLAQLVRYGSRADGMPASGPDDPLRVFPGLNPNLKVYVEVSNEVWNSAGDFEQTRQADDEAVAAGLSPVGSPARAEWDVINYDGALNTTDTGGASTFSFPRLGRWYALRTVRMSEQFRTVFGDQMGDDARVILYWQYNNANNTALNELEFLDDYFNNGDGIQHVATPRPLSYYLWGAGGASYYGSGNSQGRTDTNPFTNPSFDDNGGLPLNQTTPRPTTVTGWTFSGNAGILGRATTTPAPTYTSDGFTLGTAYNPSAGDHTAYLMRGGSMSTSLTFTQSGRYAIGFTARGHHSLPLDFTIDGQRITPQYRPYRGVGEADPATGAFPLEYSWNLNFGFNWEADLTTATFDVVVPAGGSRTVNFTIAAAPLTGTPGSGQYNYDAPQTMQFDNFYVGTVDAIFAAGIPDTGQALGQVGTGSWTRDRQQIAQFALAYGLEPASYESGWSLGGDNGASPLQNWAKYRDPRARLVNNAAIDTHSLAGYGLVVYGVYEQWRDYEVQNAAAAPLRQSFAETNDRLALEPTGLTLPLTLTAPQQAVSYAFANNFYAYSRTADANLTANEWTTWTVFADRAGDYMFALHATAGGTARVAVDDATTVLSGATGAPLTGTVYLSRGLHSVKIRHTSGAFQFQRLEVAQAQSPPAPTLTSLVEGDGQVSVAWQPVAGATAYRVRWGTTPGVYTNSVVAAAGTSATVSGLTNGTVYYFAVAAMNAAGEGLPSAERGVIPLATDQVGELGRWEFFGYAGSEASGPPVISSGRAVVSPVTRGPGLVPGDGWVSQYNPNRFSSLNNAPGSVWATTLTDAATRGQYYVVSVTPQSGQSVSLTSLNFQGWTSHTAPQSALQYSVGGGGFVTVPLTGAANDAAGLTADLSAVAALQNATAPVTFRVYLYGLQAYTANGIGLGTSSPDMVLRGSTRSLAPTLTRVFVNGFDPGTPGATYSRVTSLGVVFGVPVSSVDAGAFTLTRGATTLTNGSGIVVSGFGTNTLTLTFTGATGVEFGSLADGVWTLSTDLTRVRNAAGVAGAGTSATNNIRRLFGDADGDGLVNLVDFGLFGNTFGKGSAAAGFNPAFDHNGDGVINLADFGAFGTRFGKGL